MYHSFDLDADQLDLLNSFDKSPGAKPGKAQTHQEFRESFFGDIKWQPRHNLIPVQRGSARAVMLSKFFLGKQQTERHRAMRSVPRKSFPKRTNTLKRIRALQAANSRTYVFRDPSGNLHTITNLSAFCRDVFPELNVKGMSMVACGVRKGHKGWQLACERPEYTPRSNQSQQRLEAEAIRREELARLRATKKPRKPPKPPKPFISDFL